MSIIAIGIIQMEPSVKQHHICDLVLTPHCLAGILAYNGTSAVRLGDKLWAISLAMLLS